MRLERQNFEKGTDRSSNLRLGGYRSQSGKTKPGRGGEVRAKVCQLFSGLTRS